MFFIVFVMTAIGFVARFISHYQNVACIQNTLLKVASLRDLFLCITNALLIHSVFLDWEKLHCRVYIIHYY
jgi:hypothetical protein